MLKGGIVAPSGGGGGAIIVVGGMGAKSSLAHRSRGRVLRSRLHSQPGILRNSRYRSTPLPEMGSSHPSCRTTGDCKGRCSHSWTRDRPPASMPQDVRGAWEIPNRANPGKGSRVTRFARHGRPVLLQGGEPKSAARQQVFAQSCARNGVPANSPRKEKGPPGLNRGPWKCLRLMSAVTVHQLSPIYRELL